MSFQKQQRGFTIVELMIAMVLGLVLAGVVVTLFVQTRHGFDRDESIIRMQDDARAAIRELANDLSMAGFWADLLLPAAVTGDGNLATAVDCGPAGVVNWIYRAVTPGTDVSHAVTIVNNATGATANAAYSCIAADEIVPGTDVVAIKRVSGARVVGAAVANTVYLRTNGTLGLLYREPVAAPAVNVPPPRTEWEYRPSIYYVRNFAITPGDGIPTLCRKVLRYSAALPSMVTECLAHGVENLQIEYGLDDDGDGEPNLFVTDPTLAELQSAVAARIYVLARSATSDIKYMNEKTYNVSDAPAFAPADRFYRRVFSITVGIHNVRSLRGLRS